MEEKKRLLVVDDEEDICAIVQYHLTREGYAVDVALSAEEAFTHDLSRCSLIVLDVMMPGMSGFEMAAKLKSNPSTATVPIIFLTAMDTDENVVAGLKLGADDYISKPFSPSVLKARVEAVLRRSESPTPATDYVLTFQGIKIDNLQMSVSVNDINVQATRLEFELLKLLVSHVGRVFSREEILSKVWPDDTFVTDRTVDVNIARLRKKLGAYGEFIHTRVGYGYSFMP